MDAKVVSMIAELPRSSVIHLLCEVGQEPAANVNTLTLRCVLHDLYVRNGIDGSEIATEWESLS